MQDVVILKWTFSPPDFFEKPINITREDYRMTIDNGKVEARIDPDTYDKKNNMRDELHVALNDRFLCALLLTHKPYNLSKSDMYRLHPDGSKDIIVFPEPCVLKINTNAPDIVIKDKDGNVISDTRKERIEKKMKIADLVEKYRSKDKLVASLLKSYEAAVNDPDNELVHLYEIREALLTRFGKEATAKTEMVISGKKWSRFGDLANKRPVKQGRHRGKSAGELRDATEDELNEARSFAVSLFEGYLKNLEKEEHENI